MNQLIKKIAMEAVRNSSPVRLLEAIIVSAPPNIQIKLKGHAKLVIPKSLILATEDFLRKKIEVGDQVMVVSIQGGQSFLIIDRFSSFS